jgi:hypothetical protein
MYSQFEKSFKSASPFERATVAKSFKFGASKESPSIFEIEMSIEHLAGLARDADINVRRYSLESLTAITHTLPNVIKSQS